MLLPTVPRFLRPYLLSDLFKSIMVSIYLNLVSLNGEENLPPCSEEEGVDLRSTLIPGVTCLEDIEYDYEYLDVDGEETGM